MRVDACRVLTWRAITGTGALSESGAGDGEGYTINLPVPGGSGHDEWLGLVQHVVVPAAREYAPELVFVSAGFDAHRDDPLATCLLTEESYAAIAAEMRALADDLGAPLVIVLEGGYDLDALARSVAATMAAAADGQMPEEAPASPIVERARSHFARWWATRVAPEVKRAPHLSIRRPCPR